MKQVLAKESGLLLVIAVVASMAAVSWVETASATTIEIGGVAQNSSVEIQATLKSGTSAILKDEFGTTTDTCTTSEVKGKTEGTFTGATVGGKVSTLTFKNCTHTTTVIANGSLSVAGITNTTNGTVSSSGAEVTVQSTFFGASAVCKTGTGTKIGTLTGVKEGFATVDVSAVVNCGILGNASWTGTYTVTSPEGQGANQ